MNGPLPGTPGSRLLRAGLLTPLAGAPPPWRGDCWRLYRDGALLIDGQGRIKDVGEYRRLADEHREVATTDLSSRLIVPGFVDAHTHLPQYPAIGLYGKRLLDWLNSYIFPAEGKFTPAEADRLCPIFFDRLLANGVVTAAIYSSVRLDSTWKIFEWAEAKGIRAIIGKAMMDRNSPDYLLEETGDSIAGSRELCERWHGRDGGRLLYAYTPRFAGSCSRELMAAAGALAREHDAYVQTHLSENLEAIKWVRGLFPEARNYTEIYARAGLLGRKTLLAHAIHIDRDEQALLAQADTALVHCPTSNLFLRSGLMRLADLLSAGYRLALGSDVAGGPTLSPFSVMRASIHVHNARRLLLEDTPCEVTPAVALYLATLGGATALGLDAVTGSLEAGKDADFVVLDATALGAAAADSAADLDRLLSRLVFVADDRIVERTYVRGRLCYERPASGPATG